MSEKIEKNQIHLDFACGPGTFIREYLNNSSTGVDVSEKQIEYAKSLIKKIIIIFFQSLRSLILQTILTL